MNKTCRQGFIVVTKNISSNRRYKLIFYTYISRVFCEVSTSIFCIATCFFVQRQKIYLYSVTCILTLASNVKTQNSNVMWILLALRMRQIRYWMSFTFPCISHRYMYSLFTGLLYHDGLFNSPLFNKQYCQPNKYTSVTLCKLLMPHRMERFLASSVLYSIF